MLVLTRRADAGDRSVIQIISPRIGDDIAITLVSVEGGNVRLGVTAPRDVAVHRREVYDEKQSQGEKHASEGPREPR